MFPELSLTGYELEARPVAPDDPALIPIADACAATGSLALAGAPVADEQGRLFIAMLRIDANGAQVAYHKTWLGGREPARFTPGSGPAVLEIDGWRLGLAICKDTGAAQHTTATAALGVDAYLAGLAHHPQELPEQEARAIVVAVPAGPTLSSPASPGPPGMTSSRRRGARPSGPPEASLSLVRDRMSVAAPAQPWNDPVSGEEAAATTARRLPADRSSIGIGSSASDLLVACPKVADRARCRSAWRGVCCARCC